MSQEIKLIEYAKEKVEVLRSANFGESSEVMKNLLTLIDQQAQEINRLRNYLETLRSNTPYGLYRQQITEVLQDAQEYPCTCGNCDGEHFGMALGRE